MGSLIKSPKRNTEGANVAIREAVCMFDRRFVFHPASLVSPLLAAALVTVTPWIRIASALLDK
jgi:hypothetical protein